MYLLFSLVFLLSVFEWTIEAGKYQWNDEHPFIGDGAKKHNEKFMLIPSIAFESEDQPGKFILFLDGWYFQALNPSRDSSRQEKRT